MSKNAWAQANELAAAAEALKEAQQHHENMQGDLGQAGRDSLVMLDLASQRYERLKEETGLHVASKTQPRPTEFMYSGRQGEEITAPERPELG